jgi:hypothetical protein
MSRRIVIVDTDATAQTPDYTTGAGVIWELSAIERDTGREHTWRLEPDIAKSDPETLAADQYQRRATGMLKRSAADLWVDVRVGNVCDLTTRTGTPADPWLWSDPGDLAPLVGQLLEDVTLISANPGWDTGFLDAFLTAHDWHARRWHWRTGDAGAMAWAWLQAQRRPCPPFDATVDEFADALGLNSDAFEPSTLGYCRMVDVMLRVLGVH